MNWDAISAVAESLAALGVIASLIYLAIQIRRDGDATVANTRQMRATAARDALLALATSESYARVVARSIDEPEPWVQAIMQHHGMDLADALQLNAHFLNLIRQLEGALRMPMSDQERQQSLDYTARILQGNARHWWASARVVFAKDFVALIDEHLDGLIEADRDSPIRGGETEAP